MEFLVNQCLSTTKVVQARLMGKSIRSHQPRFKAVPLGACVNPIFESAQALLQLWGVVVIPESVVAGLQLVPGANIVVGPSLKPELLLSNDCDQKRRSDYTSRDLIFKPSR